MNELAKRDRQIQQLYRHMEELENLLKTNYKNIHTKEKTNKHLSDIKKQFKEYDDSLKNLKEQQLKSFNSLKLYLQSLNPEEYGDEILADLEEIERETKKLM